MALLDEVLAGIAQIDRLNRVEELDLAPYRAELAELETKVAGDFADFADSFAAETAGADPSTFLECLQNLFEIYWGDLHDEIARACRLSHSDPVGSRIYSELMRRVARIALAP